MSSPRAPNFNLVARPYRMVEYLTFGTALQRARLRFLPQLDTHRRALILGDGDGRFCAALLAANPRLHADAVDLSPAMLRLLTRRAFAAHPTASARLHTYADDAQTVELPRARPYDLIVTHFFLDCFNQTDLDRLCLRLRPHLAPDATWILSDFRIPPAGLLRLPARILVRALYLAFRLLSGLRITHLPDHAAALARIGLKRTTVHRSLGGLLTSELWQLIPPHSSSLSPRSTLPTMLPPQRLHPATDPKDPVPNPEPASPSLPEPDPGVFHHDPTPTPPAKPASGR
ncbi:MAG: hypothetical protein NVSMB62_22850 [Acidobacteriaceae bacterium]